jgi:hypothetical protein
MKGYERKKLPIADIIVPLRWSEMPGEEDTGMELLVFHRALRQNCPHANVSGIHLYHEGREGSA